MDLTDSTTEWQIAISDATLELAHRLVRPKNPLPLFQSQLDEALSSVSDKELTELAAYFHKICYITPYIGADREKTLEDIKSYHDIITRCEHALDMPASKSHFVTTEQLTVLMGCGGNEKYKQAIERSVDEIFFNNELTINQDGHDRIMKSTELVMFGRRHTHIKFYFHPDLAGYFRNAFGILEADFLPEERKSALSMTAVTDIVRGGESSKENIAEVREFVEGLWESAINLSLDENVALNARDAIIFHNYGAVKAEQRTMFVLPEAMPYILYNYCCPRSMLPNGDRFQTSTKICRLLSLQPIPENMAAVQSILNDIRREPARDIALQFEGEEKTITTHDAVRKLSAKRIAPSYFIHEDALAAGLINRDMVIERREAQKPQKLAAIPPEQALARLLNRREREIASKTDRFLV